MMLSKSLFQTVILIAALGALSACSTNPATGKTQFAGLMSPAQEMQVGASEHQKVMQQFGEYSDPAVQSYVREVGRKVTQETERPEVDYKFYVIDSPIVNAFALPGGYIYVSRGLLALANSEAELAAVMAHETGHITARHSAERYSHGVLTSLGAAVISSAVGSSGVSQALGLGSNLYLTSYSRGQENEADSLGLRYMTRGGYDPAAMSSFLSSLQNESMLDSKIEGRDLSAVSYFSTHPATSERISKTSGEAATYAKGGMVGSESHMAATNGLIYGDSPAQGYVRGRSFFHPGLGFGFDVPAGFTLHNQPTQVVATSNTGAVVIFDMITNNDSADAFSYLTQIWMQDEIKAAERISVNGMNAATASFPGTVNGSPVTVRVVAIQWGPNNFARFQIAIPKNAPTATVEGLKTASYSFHRLTDAEKNSLRPYRIKYVTATAGDTAASLARRQPFDNLQEERFRLLNALPPGQQVQPGQKYKIVSDN